MTPETATHDSEARADLLDDVHKRLVRVHAALAERTNSEVHEVIPWTLDELIAVIREVQAFRNQPKTAS